MLVNIGDKVTHNQFPPVDGVVVAVQSRVNNQNLLGVLRSDTGTVYWDIESSWEKVSFNGVKSSEEIVDAEFVEC